MEPDKSELIKENKVVKYLPLALGILSVVLLTYIAFTVGQIKSSELTPAASLAQYERVSTQVINTHGTAISQLQNITAQVVCAMNPAYPGCPKK